MKNLVNPQFQYFGLMYEKLHRLLMKKFAKFDNFLIQYLSYTHTHYQACVLKRNMKTDGITALQRLNSNGTLIHLNKAKS